MTASARARISPTPTVAASSGTSPRAVSAALPLRAARQPAALIRGGGPRRASMWALASAPLPARSARMPPAAWPDWPVSLTVPSLEPAAAGRGVQRVIGVMTGWAVVQSELGEEAAPGVFRVGGRHLAGDGERCPVAHTSISVIRLALDVTLADDDTPAGSREGAESGRGGMTGAVQAVIDKGARRPDDSPGTSCRRPFGRIEPGRELSRLRGARDMEAGSAGAAGMPRSRPRRGAELRPRCAGTLSAWQSRQSFWSRHLQPTARHPIACSSRSTV